MDPHARAQGQARRGRAVAKQAAQEFTLGSPFDAARVSVRSSPRPSRSAFAGYISKGIEEGATLVTGGPEQPEALPKGYFVKPTVFANVEQQMTIAQQEIFGPVLCIIPYDDEEDADPHRERHGLRPRRGRLVGRRRAREARRPRIRTGQIDINGGSFNPMAPFGGYKQSGRGREYGKWGFEEFLEVKSIQL